MDKINKFLPIVTMLLTGVFWFFTINGIPARVSSLESDVKALKEQMIQNSVKTDIILDDVKFLKHRAMQKGE